MTHELEIPRRTLTLWRDAAFVIGDLTLIDALAKIPGGHPVDHEIVKAADIAARNSKGCAAFSLGRKLARHIRTALQGDDE